MSLSPEARVAILDASRFELASALGVAAELPELDANVAHELADKRGAFVTLKTDGRLRGCLGRFEADMSALRCVRKMTRASLLEDPRFVADRITPSELSEVNISISLLSPLLSVDDYREIRLGVDGIQIVQGFRRGCFLPSVATELGLNLEEFLSMCSEHKAGLPPDAWRDAETKLFRFETEVVAG